VTPVCMMLHPVGIGSTRAMNVSSAKIWLRALVESVPTVSFDASWLPYAETMIDRERGIHDALAVLDRCDAVVAVGGEFSRGMIAEWQRAATKKLRQIDLTRSPMPTILTIDSYAKTRSTDFRAKISEAFAPMLALASGVAA
jgi:hypothetical protein